MGHKAKRVQFGDSQLPITEDACFRYFMEMGIFIDAPKLKSKLYEVAKFTQAVHAP